MTPEQARQLLDLIYAAVDTQQPAELQHVIDTIAELTK